MAHRAQRQTKSAQARSQRGVTMVESALILGVVCYILLAVLDIAQFLHIQQVLMERARGAARTGAVKNLTADQVRNQIVYGRLTAPEGVTVGSYGLRPEHVTVTILDRTYTSQRMNVTISNVPMKTVSPFLGRALKNIPVETTVPLETP